MAQDDKDHFCMLLRLEEYFNWKLLAMKKIKREESTYHEAADYRHSEEVLLNMLPNMKMWDN